MGKRGGKVEERRPRNTLCRDLDAGTKEMGKPGDRWKRGGLKTHCVETWMQIPSKCVSVGTGGRETAHKHLLPRPGCRYQGNG
ncbi:hypothetical protein DPMN_078348 [Dreissena polymorpha]|uniref:Uncharacterized protein n=1 Tax=Dreissena polymorpha TaxID=45954 RepID=A0A9D3YR12_DREPO|nr:hypothetical protein DPMN_078348 [Dreissena polymorpha]